MILEKQPKKKDRSMLSRLMKRIKDRRIYYIATVLLLIDLMLLIPALYIPFSGEIEGGKIPLAMILLISTIMVLCLVCIVLFRIDFHRESK